MVAEFNRSNARDLSRKIEDKLKELSELGVEFKICGGKFTADTLNLKLEVTLKSGSGERIISDNHHKVADSRARSLGVNFKGHIIGSVWKSSEGSLFRVTDVTERPKYPISFVRYGEPKKSSANYLKTSTQISQPTLLEFKKWFTIDPDSDAVKESDVEICDRVWEYMEAVYPSDKYEEFYENCEEIFNRGVADVFADDVYGLCFSGNIEAATKLLATEKSKRKTKRK